jgi:uncharacterized protein YlxP (DUF503 family)
MFNVAICKLILYLPDSHSLKDKRQIIRSIRDKLKNKNFSIAETGSLNDHKKAEIGFAIVSNDQNHNRMLMEKTLDFISDNYPCEIISAELDNH